MEWEELRSDNLPKQGSWILITDGTDWRRVFVTNQFEFVEHPDDKLAYSEGITHWCNVVLPNGFKLNKMPSKRELAMDWWNNLSWTDKGNLMEGELKHKHPQSLTESEIEKLWLNMQYRCC